MPGDHYRKPLFGTRRPVSALAMRSMIDAARKSDSVKAIVGRATPESPDMRIFAKSPNAEADHGDVLGLAEILNDDTTANFRLESVWRAEAYSVQKHGLHNICVLQKDGIVGDEVVPVTMGGTVHVQADITDDTHTHVVPKDGESTFQSDWAGFPITGKISNTGLQWVEIKLELSGDWFLYQNTGPVLPAGSIFLQASGSQVVLPNTNRKLECITATNSLPVAANGVMAPPYAAISPGYSVAAGAYFTAPSRMIGVLQAPAGVAVGETIGALNGSTTPVRGLPGFRVLHTFTGSSGNYAHVAVDMRPHLVTVNSVTGATASVTSAKFDGTTVGSAFTVDTIT